MIIAIDGPASAGKSSASEAVAERLGFKCMNTGAMFRAIAVKALREGIDADAEACGKMAANTSVRFEYPDSSCQPSKVFCDGEDVTSLLRTPEADDASSRTSTYPGVRKAVLEIERELGATGDFVVEGRDIGTVVFPDAELKVFLTADAESRAKRRWRQWENTGALPDVSFEELVSQIEERDERDSNRSLAPLAPAADAHLLDNSEMTLEETVDAITSWLP